MGIFELIFQPISYFFLVPTIILLLILLNAFVLTNPSIASAFNGVCESQVEQILFSDYDAGSGDAFFQVALPQGFDPTFKYDSKAFEIMKTLYSDISIKSVMGTYSGDIISRQNFGLLRMCEQETCLCAIDTGITDFSFEYFNLTACFHLIYSDDAAKAIFNQSIINADASKSNYEIFKGGVTDVLDSLNSFTQIRECYDLANSNQFQFSYENDNQFIYSSIPNSNKEISDLLENFYEITKAGLLFHIKECSLIPNKDYCTYTQDITGDYLIGANQTSYAKYMSIFGSQQQYNRYISQTGEIPKINLRDDFKLIIGIAPKAQLSLKGIINQQENLIIISSDE